MGPDSRGKCPLFPAKQVFGLSGPFFAKEGHSLTSTQMRRMTMFGFKKRKAKEKPGRTTPTATDAQTNPVETNVRGQTLTSNAS